MIYNPKRRANGRSTSRIQPGAQTEYQHNLPPVRIAAVEQGWLPVVSGLNPKTTYDQSNFSTDPRTEQNICVN